MHTTLIKILIKVNCGDYEKGDWCCPWCLHSKEMNLKMENQTKQVTQRMNSCLEIIINELFKEYEGKFNKTKQKKIALKFFSTINKS